MAEPFPMTDKLRETLARFDADLESSSMSGKLEDTLNNIAVVVESIDLACLPSADQYRQLALIRSSERRIRRHHPMDCDLP